MEKNEPKPQLDKFKALARELEADEDETRWDDRLKKVAKVKTADIDPVESGKKIIRK